MRLWTQKEHVVDAILYLDKLIRLSLLLTNVQTRSASPFLFVVLRRHSAAASRMLVGWF